MKTCTEEISERNTEKLKSARETIANALGYLQSLDVSGVSQTARNRLGSAVNMLRSLQQDLEAKSPWPGGSDKDNDGSFAETI